MVADRLRIRALIDADRAEAAIALLDDIAADPAHLVRHFVIPDRSGLGRSCFEFLRARPGAGAADRVQFHDVFPWLMDGQARSGGAHGTEGQRLILCWTIPAALNCRSPRRADSSQVEATRYRNC